MLLLMSRTVLQLLLISFLMKWISKEGKDMFNLQANSFDIEMVVLNLI